MNNSVYNPFNITFGKLPSGIIDRHGIYDEVISSFSNPTNGAPLYILVGARGSGKTVTMTSIANYYKDDNDWIVVDLNPHQDLLEQLASMIIQKGKLKKFFLKKEFSISFRGISFSLTGDEPVTNVISLLEIILTYLKKKNISVLITIDEANNNEHMRVFAHSFQSFLRNDFKVNLLMTGLYENISSLENSKSLSFLYRAPKIYLPPLSIRAIMQSYILYLNMAEADALQAALITKGYAFAYQLLGYILFKQEKKKIDEKVLIDFDLALEEKSYAKIYSELTAKEKEIVESISEGKTTNEEIINYIGIKENSLSVYKQTLSKKGIIDTSQRGKVSFMLPRFKEFILFKKLL